MIFEIGFRMMVIDFSREFFRKEHVFLNFCFNLQNGPTTVIVDPATNKEKPYSFDYSFWSHDGFEDDDGISKALPGTQYAD